MKKLFLLLNFYGLFAQNITTVLDANTSELIKELQDKNTAVVANQTSILQNKEHLIDFLVSKNIKVQSIFAPEHGFRGDADAGESPEHSSRIRLHGAVRRQRKGRSRSHDAGVSRGGERIQGTPHPRFGAARYG